jgi:selenocysteine-specific elongation factor
MAAEAGGKGLSAPSLAARLGLYPGAVAGFLADSSLTVVKELAFSATVIAEARTAIVRAVQAAHRERPLEPGASVQALRDAVHAIPELVDHALATLVEAGEVTVNSGYVARKGWSAGAGEGGEKRLKVVRDALESAGHAPPSIDELTSALGKDVPALLKLLVRRAEAVPVASDRYFSARATAELQETIGRALANGAALTTSQLREATALTRKYIIPFLEYCDRTGFTYRRGDVRLLAKPGEGTSG